MSPLPLSEFDANRHIDDDGVVQWLDTGPADSPWGPHLADCAACRARVNLLASAADVLRIAYKATPIPAHIMAARRVPRVQIKVAPTAPSRTDGRWPRLAAGLLLLAALGVATASPIRRFMRDIVGSRPQTAVAIPRVTMTLDHTDTASIAFGVTSASITLDFASPPGALRARLGSGDTLRLYVTSTTSLHAEPIEPKLVALPAGIRIANAPQTHDTYDVTLPARTQELRVRVSGRDVSVVQRPGLSTGSMVLPLGTKVPAP